MGTIQDQALANERLADYYVEEGSVSEARYCLEQAVKLYSEWKAAAKVELLRRNLSHLGHESGEKP